MDDLENKLENIGEKAAKLSEKVNGFIANLDFLDLLDKFNFLDFKHLSNFKELVTAIRTYADQIAEKVIEKDKDALYELVKQLYHPMVLAIPKPDSEEKYHISDPITRSLRAFAALAEDYETNILVASNIFRDAIIRSISFNKDRYSTKCYLATRRYQDIGDSVKDYIKEIILRPLQKVANFDIDGLFHDYIGLIEEIDSKLRDHVKKPFNIPKRKYFDPTSLKGRKVEIDDKILKKKLDLIEVIDESDDWVQHLEAIADYMFMVNEKIHPLERSKIVWINDDVEYEPQIWPKVKRKDIIGLDKQVDDIYDHVNAFAKGYKVKHMIFVGEQGVGKTYTIQMVAQEIGDIKIAITDTDIFTSRIKKIVDDLTGRPYRSVVMVEDYSLPIGKLISGLSIEERFKTCLEGVTGFPDNVLIILCMNEYILKALPSPLVGRFRTIEFPFDKKNIEPIIRSYCDRSGYPYDVSLIKTFTQYHKKLARTVGKNKLQVCPRLIKDFVEDKAAVHKAAQK